MTFAASARRGEDAADGRQGPRPCSTNSHYLGTLSSLGARSARELAGRPEPAGDDELLLSRPPRQGCARDRFSHHQWRLYIFLADIDIMRKTRWQSR